MRYFTILCLGFLLSGCAVNKSLDTPPFLYPTDRPYGWKDSNQFVCLRNTSNQQCVTWW